MPCLLKPRLPLSFTDINDGVGGDSSLIITFLLLAITEKSRETFPLRTQRKERIKYKSHQLHELKAAFKINQYPTVSEREHLAKKIGVTESQIQAHNPVLLQHIFPISVQICQVCDHWAKIFLPSVSVCWALGVVLKPKSEAQS